MAHVLMFILGLVLWTLLEYTVHRWLFHGVLKKHHQHHHVFPKIPRPIPIWALALPMLGLFWLSVGLGLGVLAGLVVYEAVHERCHHGKPRSPWLMRIQTQHYGHHQFPKTNYGMLTGFWDQVFQTRRKR